MSIENIGELVKTVYVVIICDPEHQHRWGVMSFKTRSDAEGYVSSEDNFWETQMKDHRTGGYFSPKKKYLVKEFVEKE